MSWIAGVGRFAFFALETTRAMPGTHRPWSRAIAEAYNIGIKSLPILLVIAAFVGTNLSLQGYLAFEPLGGQRLVGMFVALAGMRELAPIIAASMVAAKAGTEMASAIAVMRIREQIDALEVLAVEPRGHLVTPRFLGILLVMPALTAISIATMVGAGYLVATLQLGLNGATFMEHAIAASEPGDIFWSLFKALLFGVVICLVSCYQGFNSGPGPEGVGSATNRAVVVSAVTCVALNYLLSEIYYG
ncbi:MAG TPA: ABC transporter permease [Myxococcota bacterium]|nr:ABC transporter permease [Myxococcota bacterium]